MVKKIMVLFPIVFSCLCCSVFAMQWDEKYNNTEIPESVCDKIVNIDSIIIKEYVQFTSGDNVIKVPFYDDFTSVPGYYSSISESTEFLKKLGIDISKIEFVKFETSSFPSVYCVRFNFNSNFNVTSATYLNPSISSGGQAGSRYFFNFRYSVGNYFSQGFFLPSFAFKDSSGKLLVYYNKWVEGTSSLDFKINGNPSFTPETYTLHEGDYTGGSSGGGDEVELSYEFVNPPQSDNFLNYSISDGFPFESPVRLKITNNSDEIIPSSVYSYEFFEISSGKVDKKEIDTQFFNLPDIPSRSTYFFNLPLSKKISLNWQYHYRFSLFKNDNLKCQTFIKVTGVGMTFVPSSDNDSELVEHEKNNLKIEFYEPVYSNDFVLFDKTKFSVKVKIANTGLEPQSNSYIFNLTEVDENKNHVIERVNSRFNTEIVPAGGYLIMEVPLLRSLSLNPHSRFKMTISMSDVVLATSYFKTGIYVANVGTGGGDIIIGDKDGNIEQIPSLKPSDNIFPITNIDWLDAILNFFNSLVDGIISFINKAIELFNSVLGFGKSFAGFLGSFFSWIPYSYMSILTLGLTISLLAIILKILRG